MSPSRHPLDQNHERIKHALRLREVLLSDIAEELGVSRALVTNAMLGRVRSRKVEAAVAAHLDTKPENLWPNRDHEIEGGRKTQTS